MSLLFTDWIFFLFVCWGNTVTLNFRVGLRQIIGSYVYHLGICFTLQEKCDFFSPHHPCSLPPSLSFLPLGPTRGLLTLSGVWGTAAECSSWKLCRWLIEKAVGLHHFLGLFRVITESEVVGCRELIEYDKPRVVKKIPVLSFSAKEHSTLPCFL